MNAILHKDFLFSVHDEEAARAILDLRNRLKAGLLSPYLGPGLLEVAGAEAAIPASPEAVAAALNLRAPAPSRIRTNMWAVAQHIEQRRHRNTLKAWMAEIFASEPQPTALHHWLAGLSLPMIVDSWYDGAMRAALKASGRRDFVSIQGITRAGETRDIWTRVYGADDSHAEDAEASRAGTVLYEPHGGARPAGNFLVADSDYVEVLTEIDIQTPIPDVVKDRRGALGFLFLGCRFHDQMLRTYARQILKRSKGPHYAVMTGEALTRNERRFLTENGITLVDMPLHQAVDLLVG
ncbi:MAG: SIR2 family protein [Alphaproteobacteria bacterium]|nr:SIR2 family protein [Rhizobiaceae bacterium]MBU3963291.1 SIR2 family protein [Alphaproteobacteria bacterium]MBU4048893.1 SIR2 family protein [Alphaproteobacteria bacterium]MBU4090314.1 SIR2 family protein [Alphaproteobacteria bacterium]MBU4158754.1 SIR2 family protein [Alphaproteobacteria bacterium]